MFNTIIPDFIPHTFCYEDGSTVLLMGSTLEDPELYDEDMYKVAMEFFYEKMYDTDMTFHDHYYTPTLKEVREIIHDNSKMQIKKHSHYYKECPYSHIDVYRILKLFDITDPCLQHAIKKLLVAGGRGHKDISTDIQDAIDTLERLKEMLAEE